MTHLAPGSREVARGRPSRPVLALDIGGTRLRTALVLPTGTLVGRRSVLTPKGDAATLVTACLALIEETRAAAHDVSGAAENEPIALGVSAPGPLDPMRGVLTDPPNLDRTLWGFPLADTLAAAVGLPVALERDTQVAALAEGRFGAARGLRDYIYVTVSTGIGGGVVIDGRLMRGPDGAAGEVGHLMIDADGPVCGCGARGHLEGIASGTGIAAAARAALESGVVAPDSPLGRLASDAAAGSRPPIEASDIADAEDEGDPVAKEIMGAARSAFADALVSLVDIFNPSRIVVGGGVAAGQGDRLLGPARERVRELAFRTQAGRVEIVPAELGDDVSLVGALLLVELNGLDQLPVRTSSPVRDDPDPPTQRIDNRQAAAAK